MKRLVFLLLVLAPLALFADEAERSRIFRYKVHERRLENGMRILVVPRQTPTVACQLWLDVGSADDPYGMSGAAHMIEHMMFKGTRIIGTKDYSKERPLLEEMMRVMRLFDAECRKEDSDYAVLEALKQERERLLGKLRPLQVQREIWDILKLHGAEGINATTSFDWTVYYCSLPANRLEAWAWIESDRLKNAVFREFYSERMVVLEEMRKSIDDSAWGRAYAELRALAFVEHPYRRPIIGFENDVKFMDPMKLKKHWERFYRPSNITAVIVGGVEPKEVFELMERYFGRIKRGVEEPKRTDIVEPKQDSERRSLIYAPFKNRLVLGFHRPELTHPDFPSLELLALILTYGHSSRLYRTLVKKKKSVTAINCWNRDSEHPDLFVIRAVPAEGRTTFDVEKQILEEIEKVAKEGVSEAELERAKRKSLFGIASSVDTNAGIAWQLGYYQTTAGDWRFIHTVEESIRGVTPEDIRRVASRYLKRTNMSVVHLLEKRK